LKPLSDNEVIGKVLNGNPELYRLLVERYKNPVAAVIKGMLGDCPEAEDVGQEAFIRLYNSLADFRGDASLKTYLIRIAMNLSLNEIKKRKRYNNSTVYLDSVENIIHEVEMPAVERTEIYESIQNAMDQLDHKHRSVFFMRIVEGYSTKETAEVLKIPVGTVLSRLSRALEEMRKLVIR
jgi:RNA polymerase sigma-70 factor (ECF subfamily)